MEKQNKVWLITGEGRGLGVDLTKSALAAGFTVVATGRNTDKVAKAIGVSSDNLFIVKLDVTNPRKLKQLYIQQLTNSAGLMYWLIMPLTSMQVFLKS